MYEEDARNDIHIGLTASQDKRSGLDLVFKATLFRRFALPAG
jgi:hypothetical protein